MNVIFIRQDKRKNKTKCMIPTREKKIYNVFIFEYKFKVVTNNYCLLILKGLKPFRCIFKGLF